SSTHNTRIERLWVEVGSQFARRWRAFFYRLERVHGLDRTNPHHLWLLHLLFLDDLNEDCATFQEEWNAHPISGEGHDQSPNDMFFLGQTRDGVYIDDCAGVHPNVVSQYYGVHGPVREPAAGETGAGQLNDEAIPQVAADQELDEDDWEDLEERIEGAHAANFHHEAVAVPKHANPFSGEAAQVFEAAFEQVQAANVIPGGYGLLEEEWEDAGYPSFEILKSGRSKKELRIALPDFIWRPRAILWGQALDVLNQVNYIYNT
ncbi:hypothetical protein B0H14DRAFT_2409566, partial [Mycena olivaceomarginata]